MNMCVEMLEIWKSKICGNIETLILLLLPS
jgi:hypothetical protein